MLGRELRPAFLHRAPPIRRDQLLALLNQSRQRRLAVRADIEIDLGIVAELLNVGFMRKVDREMLMIFALRARAARAALETSFTSRQSATSD